MNWTDLAFMKGVLPVGKSEQLTDDFRELTFTLNYSSGGYYSGYVFPVIEEGLYILKIKISSGGYAFLNTCSFLEVKQEDGAISNAKDAFPYTPLVSNQAIVELSVGADGSARVIVSSLKENQIAPTIGSIKAFVKKIC